MNDDLQRPLGQEQEMKQGQARKPYQPPTLQVFGSIRQLTQSVGMNGMGDGAPGNGHAYTQP